MVDMTLKRRSTGCIRQPSYYSSTSNNTTTVTKVKKKKKKRPKDISILTLIHRKFGVLLVFTKYQMYLVLIAF